MVFAIRKAAAKKTQKNKKSKQQQKVKTKPNSSYNDQFAICACFTAVCTQLNVLFVVPCLLPVLELLWV